MNRRLAQGFPGELLGEKAVIALGANLGERAATLDAALDELAALPLTTLVAAADPVETVAVTPTGPDPSRPGYLNTVAVVRTRLAPSVLLAQLHAIEHAHGRVRGEHWGDRTLDLDLIVYGEVRSDDPALLLPHPRAAEREFVLGPWLAADPDAVLPGVGPVSELCARLQAAEAAGAAGERRP